MRQLLDEGKAAEAIAIAEACRGPQEATHQLRAVAYTHGGAMLRDMDALDQGARLWRALGAESHTGLGYNLANAELNIWELALDRDGFVNALERHRGHLHRARDLLLSAGRDAGLDDSFRVQVLTNLGNSYDGVGRDIDALAAYDEALELDPTFGMALGNKGIALLGIAPFITGHVPSHLARAAQVLDAALADRERVLEIGGAHALEHFESARAQIDIAPTSRAQRREWSDPHLSWCDRFGLFLHLSPECMSADTEALDPLFIRGVTAGATDEEHARVQELVDAFNVIKQDYVAARYLVWLASGDESPIRLHAAEVAERVTFLDTAVYARWGVRTGIAAQAYTAATNVLDKIASMVHFYFVTSRRTQEVYFKTLWHRRSRPNRADVMDRELAAQFGESSFNRGLMALCDLSCDLERPTELNELVDRRHTATHRFLALHWMLIPSEVASGSWLERVEWRTLVAGSLQQLSTARAALVYLARTIDIAESPNVRKLASADDPEGWRPTLQFYPAATEHPEIE